MKQKLRTIDLEGKIIKFQIWDYVSTQRFISIPSGYYRKVHGIVVVYDIADRESFSAIESWMNEVEKHAPDDASAILLGSKSDLENQRQVSPTEGREYADHYKVMFLETSAKNSENVEFAFV